MIKLSQLTFIILLIFAAANCAQAREGNNPFFGIEEDFIQENDIVSLSTKDLKELGVQIARTHGGPFAWGNIEKKEGEFDFSLTDRVVGEASDAGIYLFACLWPYAEWDQGHIKRNWASGRIDVMRGRIPDCRGKPQDLESYQKFVKELAERYDGDGDFGNFPISEEIKRKIRKRPVIYWEICNEPECGDNYEAAKFFCGDLRDYFITLKNSYLAIKEACPNATVVIAAPARGNTQWYYRELLGYGANNYCDAYNLHDRIDTLKPLIRGKEKPIWLSEAGGGAFIPKEPKEDLRSKEKFKREFKSTNPRMAAVNMAKTGIYSAAEGASFVTLNMAPDWCKYNTKKGSPGGQKEFFNDHLLYKNGSKSDSFYALQTLVKELEYFDRAERIEAPEGVAAFKFEFSDKNPVYVYLLETNQPRRITVNSGAKITDLFGQKPAVEENSLLLERENIYFAR